MAGGVQHEELHVADLHDVAVGEVQRRGEVGVALVPQDAVVGVQRDLRPGMGGEQLGHDRDVVVVRVRQQDVGEAAVTDELEDRAGVVRGVDDDALGVVADHPDVVLDLPRAAVEAEGALGRRVVDADATLRGRHPVARRVGAHSSTTDRRTSPACILSNAASMSARPIRSETKASRSKRPCL